MIGKFLWVDEPAACSMLSNVVSAEPAPEFDAGLICMICDG
jgi:hypothetical protein